LDQYIKAPSTGYFQGFNTERMIEFATKHNMVLQFLYPAGSYLLKGVNMIAANCSQAVDQECISKMLSNIYFFNDQYINQNYLYGFKHLTEVAIKALSPGINDPGTAVLSLNALSDLLAWRIENELPSQMKDKHGKVRVLISELSFRQLFQQYIFPIWEYGKNDLFIKQAMQSKMQQLIELDVAKRHIFLSEFLHTVQVNK
jgi:uncharacterized membrane protein